MDGKSKYLKYLSDTYVSSICALRVKQTAKKKKNKKLTWMQIWRCPNARIGYSINSRLALRGTPISYAQFGNVAGGWEGRGKGGHAGWCISHSFFAFGNVGNVVRKTWTYLVRTCHTTNDVVCHHVANRFVPFRLLGALVICHLAARLSPHKVQGQRGQGEQLNRALNTWGQLGQLGHLWVCDMH